MGEGNMTATGNARMRLTRLVQVFCVALCAAALPAHAEPAGKVLTAGGDVLVLRGSQILRLSSGAAIESGDQIHTGADGKVLIVFTDSGLIWIRSNSDFVLDEYSYANGQGRRESAFFSLLKGGARSPALVFSRREAGRATELHEAGRAFDRTKGFGRHLAGGELGRFSRQGGPPCPDSAHGPRVFAPHVGRDSDRGARPVGHDPRNDIDDTALRTADLAAQALGYESPSRSRV